VLKKRDKLRASEWAELKIDIEKSSRPGPYKNANNPPLAGIMDIFSLYHVRRGVLKAGVQTGKTQGIHILLAREADYSNGNDNALVVMADEKSIKKLSGNKLSQIFTDSPSLKHLISRNPDDTAIYSIKLNNNFRIDIGWATSEASVSSESYRILVLDELAKYKQLGNIFDMKGRTNTYGDTCRIWILSSPALEGSALDDEFDSTDIVFDYWPVCPHCNEAQIMTFDRFDWPGKETNTAKSSHVRLTMSARYHCKDCGMPWDDNDRDIAVLSAMADGDFKGWRPRGEMVERFKSVAAHYPSWVSPFMSLSEVVGRWIDAQGHPELIQKWHNTVAGNSYKEEKIDAPELETLNERAEAYAPVVPMAAGMLTAGGDVQADRIELEVVAWGLHQETWGMDYQVIFGDTSLPEVWEELDKYLLRTWRHESGEELRIERSFIDAGYRDNMVHRFTGRRNARGIFSCKGSSEYRAPELQGPNQVKLGSSRVRQYNVGGQKIKTTMFASLALVTPGPKYCHIPTTYPENWFEMIQAEHQVEEKLKGSTVHVWKKKTNAARNEAIDCRVYAIAAYMSIRNNDLKERLVKLQQKANEETQKIMPATTPSRRRPGGFVKGW